MESFLWNLLCLTVVTITFSGRVAAQPAQNRYTFFITQDPAANHELVFPRPSNIISQFSRYETVKIYRQDKPTANPDGLFALNFVENDATLLLTWTSDGTPNGGSIEWATGVTTAHYTFTGDISNLQPILDIMAPVVFADHGYYWARFQDLTDTANAPEGVSLVGLDIPRNGDMTLTNPVSNPDTVTVGGTAVMDPSDVIEGCPVKFTCLIKDAFPEPTIQWTITPNGTPLDINNLPTGFMLPPTSSVPASMSPHLYDTTSELTFTPVLTDAAGDAPFDDNVVKCTATQDRPTLLNFEMVVIESEQMLNVLVEPKTTGMTFEATINGVMSTYADGGTIDVLDGSSIVITAKVAGVRPGAIIAFDTSSLSPTNAASEGATGGTATAVVVGDTMRTYTFTPTDDNAADPNNGDILQFTATNDAVGLSGGCKVPATVSLNINVLAAPKSVMTYNHPVETPAARRIDNANSVEGGTCVYYIDILAGSDLVLTCESPDADPVAEIQFFEGDGGDLATGDTELTGGVVTTNKNVITLDASPPGAAFDITDDGRLITCRAMSTINGVLTPTDSNACIRYLDPPDSIEMYEGTTQAVLAPSPAIHDQGESLEFNCVAKAANPAAKIFWRLPSTTRGANNLAETSTSAVVSMFYDTMSILSNTLTYAADDCNLELTCTTEHLESGNANPLTDMVTVQVRVPVTSVGLEVLQTSDQAAEPGTPTTDIAADTPITTTGDTLIVLHGKNYNFRGTTNLVDPSAGFTWLLQETDGTSITANLETPVSAGLDSTISCTELASVDDFTLTSANCDTHEGKQVCVEADNTHNAAAVKSCATLQVRAEVTAVTMEIQSTVPGSTPVTPTADTFTLTDGVEYTVTCSVTGAKPDPSMDLVLDSTPTDTVMNGASLAGTTTPTGNECARVSTYTHTFTAVRNTHCGMRLFCSAINDANRLLNGNDNPQYSTSYLIQTVVPPSALPIPVITGNGNTYINTQTVTVDAGLSYTFTCTSEMADETPDIRWNLVNDANPINEIDTDILTDSPNCALALNTDDVTINPLFTTHHNYRLECVTATDAGSSSTFILLMVEVSPDAPIMYLGAPAGTPLQPTGAMADTEFNIDQGADIIFTCVAMNANPASTISWVLDASALTSMEEPTMQADDKLYDTVGYLTAAFRSAVAGDCDMMVTCTAEHMQTIADSAMYLKDMVQLKVRVPVTSVTLHVLQTSDQAAEPGTPTTDIAGDTPIGDDARVIVIHGLTYNFRGTTNLVDPTAGFTWRLREMDDTQIGAFLETPVTAGLDSTITCNEAASVDLYTLPPVNCDTHGEKKLCVEADNTHTNVAVETCAVLEVRAEVKEANMQMNVYHGTNLVNPVGGEYNLMEGVTYNVDCVVTEAKPAPTNIAIDIAGGNDLGTATLPTGVLDVITGNLNTRISTRRVSLTVVYGHCGMLLTCTASNEANTLLNVNPSRTHKVNVISPPNTVSLTLLDAGSDFASLVSTPSTRLTGDQVLADETELCLLNGKTYIFKADTDMEDPDANFLWEHRSSADVDVMELITNSGASNALTACARNPSSNDYTLTSVSCDTFDGRRFCVEASIDEFNLAPLPLIPESCVILKVKAEVKLANMVMNVYKVGETIPVPRVSDGLGLGGEEYILTDGGIYDVDCVVTQAKPAPTIAMTIAGGTTGLGTPQSPPAAVAPVVADVTTGDLNTRISTTRVRLTVAYTHCGVPLTCAALNDANLLLADSPTISYNVKVITGPGTPVITLAADSNPDQDGNSANDHVVLIEGTAYKFDCTVMANQADPTQFIKWVLKDTAGTPIGTPTISTPTETLPDCAQQEFEFPFDLAANLVKRDGDNSLSCGSLECSVYSTTFPEGPANQKATIHFQVLGPAKDVTAPIIAGGEGIQIEYEDPGTPGTFIMAAHNDDISLVAGNHMFRCKALNINPIPTGTTPAGGTPAGTCPTSPYFAANFFAINKWYMNTAATPPSDPGGADTAVWEAGQYNLQDTFPQTIAASDTCPSSLTCRLDFFPSGTAANAEISDNPFITVKITRSNPVAAVAITTVGTPAASVTAGAPDEMLTLYEEEYTLTCASSGGDPDGKITWWIETTCGSANEAGEVATGPVFTPAETVADCTLQQDDGNSMLAWTLTPVFATHNGKCLRCISSNSANTVPVVKDYILEIRTAPTGIRFGDGPADDDGDGLENDPLVPDTTSNKLSICENQPFDFTATAVASNPAVAAFTITLNDVALTSAISGVTISAVVPEVNGALQDSTVTVTFAASYLTVARNGQILKICDPVSMVCDEFILDIVASPDDPPMLTVTDPFAPRTPTSPTPRALADGAKIRLHLEKSYTFECKALNARPAAELDFSLMAPLASVVLQETPTMSVANGDKFNSDSTVIFTPGNLDATNRQLCCLATNPATDVKCMPDPVDICVPLEIIKEPSGVTMLMRMQSSVPGGRRRRQTNTEFEEVTEQYTDLISGANFDFKCIATESAPAAVIDWSITLGNGAAVSSDLTASLNAITTDTVASSATLNNLLDTSSTFSFTTTSEVLGATVKCCANHVAIPGGTGLADGGVYDEDPSLAVICKETTLRFPKGADEVQIWTQTAGLESRINYANGGAVKANAGEPLQLNCTALGSRPFVYIGWTGQDISGNTDNSFISSDCQFSYTDSASGNADPLTATVDTSKCVNLNPEEVHHGRRIYCTGTNIADLTGTSVAEHVVLDLCVPCKSTLALADVDSQSNNPSPDAYADGQEVVLLRNGQERKLACYAKGREEPSIDILIQEPGAAAPRRLTSADGIFIHPDVVDTNIAGLTTVRKDITLSLSNPAFNLNGAVLTCQCENAVIGGTSTASFKVNLIAFEVGPESDNTFIGVGNAVGFVDVDGGRVQLTLPEVVLDITGALTGNGADPFFGPDFPPPSNILVGFVLPGRRKRQVESPSNQMTCIARGTNPKVDFIWKLDGQVITGAINTYAENSILNQGNEGLVDTFSTLTFDPVYRGYHSRELCCEVSSSLVGSPIRRCAKLVVFSGPNDPLEVTGTTVVNEGASVQLKCTAKEHFPTGVFSWDDNQGNTIPVDASQTSSQATVLPSFRYEQDTTYSFVARREDNGKDVACQFEQNYNQNSIQFMQTTTEKIRISVNFCPSTSAELTGCPNAPVAPGRDVTVQCQSAVSNPALLLDWYLNNVKQTATTPSVDQTRDYGFVTVQSFTTRQLALADDGLRLQCCPTHPTANIGCGQLCSSVCTIQVAQPPPEVGCKWIRAQMTLDNINGSPANWEADYANSQSAKYQMLTTGLLSVVQQILDGLANYKSAIIPILQRSADGHIQAIVGVEFNSPYGTTTGELQQAIADATNGAGFLVGDGGSVSTYQILPNTVTAVCVCETGYCMQNAACRPSPTDYSSLCSCPANYAPPRCEGLIPGGTQPPTGLGTRYARIGMILDEINDAPAVWNSNYNDPTNQATIDLTVGLDTVLTGVFSTAFTTCFTNVKVVDLFQSSDGSVGVIVGVELANGQCQVTTDEVRQEFIKSVDSDQKIAGSAYELNADFLQETNVEEICGSDYSCSNGGRCNPADGTYYNSCVCQPGYSGERCQTIIRVPITRGPTNQPPDDGGLSTNALIGIIIGVVLFAAIVLGLCLLFCFLCGGDRERTRTRYVYSDEEEPRRGYGTPPKDGYGSYPKRDRGKAYDDWPFASEGRPPVAYNRDTFDLNFESRRGRMGPMGPRPVL